MELDGSLRGPEGGPTKHRQAKVDRGGVEGVDGVVQVEAEVLIGVERAGSGDQVLGEVLVDVPGAPLVGTGEGREADRRGEAGVVELGGNGIQASDQVPQASVAGQLGEGHSAELLGAVQVAHTAVAAVAGDDAGKRPPRDELHELREDGLATIHVQTL